MDSGVMPITNGSIQYFNPGNIGIVCAYSPNRYSKKVYYQGNRPDGNPKLHVHYGISLLL